jgi:hypothetical protein
MNRGKAVEKRLHNETSGLRTFGPAKKPFFFSDIFSLYLLFGLLTMS